VCSTITAAAYGSRIGARDARLSGTTTIISNSISKRQTRVRLLAARFARALHKHSPSKRERGMPGARCTRGLVCKIVRKGAHEHTGSAETLRHPPRNGFTAYIVLSSATNSSCHRRCRLDGYSIRLDRGHHRQLDTSNGCRDHTVLPYASAPFVRAPLLAHGKPPCEHLRADAAASTASPPTFVTTRDRPSCRERTGRAGSADLPDATSEIFFREGLDRVY
jgi:hypothetical protein